MGAQTAVEKAKQVASQSLRSCILVLGFDEAGASALAEVLMALGCPTNPDAGAAAGRDQVSELNQEVLESAGTTWDDLAPFPPEWMQSPVAAGFLKRAVRLIEQEAADRPLFLLHDPLLGRLVPFWIEALRKANCTVRPVILIRNPIELGQAFTERGLSEPLGQLLWLRYALDAEIATRGLPRLHASFEDLRSNWEALAMKAEEALELTWPTPVANAEFKVADNLAENPPARKDLQARAVVSSLVAPWVREAYKVLNGWALGEEMNAHQRLLDTIRAEFDTASTAFARLVRAERHANSKLAKDTAQAEIEALKELSLQSAAEIRGLGDALQDQRRQTTMLEAQLYELTAAKEDAELALKETGAELSASRERRKEMARVIGRREAELAARYQDLAQLQRRLTRFSPSWHARRLAGKIKKIFK